MTTAFTATADRIGYYVDEAADSNGTIVAYLFKSGGDSDGALANRATLAAIKSNNSEADFTNYAYKTLGSPSRSVDTSGDRVRLRVTSPFTWPAAGGATNNTLARIIYCYRPDGSPSDSQILPLMSTDISATTNGNDLQVTLHDDGFAVVETH